MKEFFFGSIGVNSKSVHRSSLGPSVQLPQNSKSERGASLVSYALLVALIAVIAIPSVRMLGGRVRGTAARTSCELTDAFPENLKFFFCPIIQRLCSNPQFESWVCGD